MSRDELTLAIAGVLVAAVLLGWTLHWLFARLNGGPDRPGAADAAARLHAAEGALQRSEARLAEMEADTVQRLAGMQTELDAANDRLAQARAQTEEIRDAYRRALIERRPAG
jgi:hypothetical protein